MEFFNQSDQTKTAQFLYLNFFLQAYPYNKISANQRIVIYFHALLYTICLKTANTIPI